MLGQLRVHASAGQAGRLLAWAVAWPQRTWAIEGTGGLGHLLAQQLLAAGEQVLDVPPKPGARVRLLAAGAADKNDPDDARPVAVAALRSPVRRPVVPDDHAAVLKMWANRHRDLGRTRTQVVCRLPRRGNRRLNHAIHTAAVTQIRCRHSDGRACYQRKLAEGKTGKEALRALRRRLSDTIYARLHADTPAKPAARGNRPGRARRERLHRQRGQLTPQTLALRLSHSRTARSPLCPATPTVRT